MESNGKRSILIVDSNVEFAKKYTQDYVSCAIDGDYKYEFFENGPSFEDRLSKSLDNVALIVAENNFEDFTNEHNISHLLAPFAKRIPIFVFAQLNGSQSIEEQVEDAGMKFFRKPSSGLYLAEAVRDALKTT